MQRLFTVIHFRKLQDGTLFDLQLDAQILIYLQIIHLLKFSRCFDHYPAHLQEVYVVIVYMQHLASSLCKSELSKITVL
jgi:hypothetical protein